MKMRPRLAAPPPSCRPTLASIVALLAVIAPTPSQADTTVVIEIYDGQRPTDADRHVVPVINALRGNGALAGVRLVGEAYDVMKSRPGIAVDQAALDGLLGLVDQGFRAWTEARFEDAIEILDRAVATAMHASAAMIMDSDLRDAFRRALIGLALAHKRLRHQQEATATMAEFVRSFPDNPIQQLEFGPEVFRLYTQVKSSLAELGTGSLSVSVNDPDAIVFVNEQYAPTPDRVRNLPPGRYRVLVRKRRTTGRVHGASVDAGKTASIDIDWTFDQMIHTSPAWTGFIFPDAATRKRLLASYAMQFARAVAASTIITVGIGDVESRRSVIGKVFSVDNAGPGRTASVAIEPVEASENHLHQLGAYLAGATNVAPPRDPVPPDALMASAEEPWTGPHTGFLWGAMAAGAVAIAAGGYLIYLDGRGTCDMEGGQCPDVYTTGTGGIVSIAAGTAVVCTAAYLLWRGARESSRPAQRWSITMGAINGIVVGGVF